MQDHRDNSKIYGVYCSQDFDLKSAYGAAFAALADDVLLLRPDEVEAPELIRFALCWEPAPEAFDTYPALELVIAAGAGVDRLLAHPGLRPEMKVARIRDTQQAYQMAGFAAHEVLHYERGFDQIRALRPLPKMRSFSGDMAVTEAATGADYLINLLPLTKATEGALNADLFARLAPGARLIQIGRGEHLVEGDLIAALDSGQMSAASLDVFRQAPLPADHPVWAHPKLRLTPHLTSHTLPEELVRQVIACARALRDGGTCDSIVDPARGY